MPWFSIGVKITRPLKPGVFSCAFLQHNVCGSKIFTNFEEVEIHKFCLWCLFCILSSVSERCNSLNFFMLPYLIMEERGRLGYCWSGWYSVSMAINAIFNLIMLWTEKKQTKSESQMEWSLCKRKYCRSKVEKQDSRVFLQSRINFSLVHMLCLVKTLLHFLANISVSMIVA